MFPEEANQATPSLLVLAPVLYVSVLSAVLEHHILLLSVIAGVGNHNDFTFEVTPGTAVNSCVVPKHGRQCVPSRESACVRCTSFRHKLEHC